MSNVRTHPMRAGTIETVPLYKKHGFQIISETNELKIPDYHMTRKPKASS